MGRTSVAIVVVGVLLAACATSGPPATPTQGEVVASATSAPPTQVPTATPTPSPTATSTPKATPTPEPTSTPVPVAPTSTPTVDPDPDRDGIPTAEENIYGTDAYRPDAWSDFNFVSAALDTPDKVSLYMRGHLKFIWDEPGVNYAQSAQETLVRGGGDCEDSAMFALEILTVHGWGFMGNGWADSGNWVGGLNVQWVETDPRGGHAACLYKPSGEPLYYIGNDVEHLGIVRGPFADLPQVVADMSATSNANWRWYEFFDLSWNWYGRVDKS